MAHAKPRNIDDTGVDLIDTLGLRLGTSLYKLVREEFRVGGDITDRPPPLFTGIKIINVLDQWSEEKRIYAVQSAPLPCTITAIDTAGDASDE